MLHRLDSAYYDRARAVFSDLARHQMAVDAVLSGAFPAPVYVDNPDHPQVAVTWTTQRLFLAGKPQDASLNVALRDVIARHYIPQAIAAGKDSFVLDYAPSGWEEQIDTILQDRFPIKDQHLFFTFKTLWRGWRDHLPDGYTVHEINRQIVHDPRLKGCDILLEEMASERPSVDDFLEKSFGLCLIRENELVGWCLSEYNGARQCEVGILVMEPYRRRGLGTIIASAFAEHALARGITRIGWHCWTSNIPSVALAQKAGYKQVLEYPVYFALFDRAINFAVNGNIRRARGQTREAVEWFERAFAVGDVPAWVYFEAARVYALLHEQDTALRYLNVALDKGWMNLGRLRDCEDFQVLHTAPAWAALLARLKSQD